MLVIVFGGGAIVSLPLFPCPSCDGTGRYTLKTYDSIGKVLTITRGTCLACSGRGKRSLVQRWFSPRAPAEAPRASDSRRLARWAKRPWPGDLGAKDPHCFSLMQYAALLVRRKISPSERAGVAFEGSPSGLTARMASFPGSGRRTTVSPVRAV